MVDVTVKKNIYRFSKEIGPVFLILILSVAFFTFSGQFAFLKSWESIHHGFLRFFRATLFLCLRLYLLLPLYSKLGLIFRRKRKILIQVETKQGLEKGIGLLFAT